MGQAAFAGILEGGAVKRFPPEWRTLSYFNFYRVVLAGLLAVLAYADIAPTGAGSSAGLFTAGSVAYLIFGIFCSFWIRWRKPGWDVQVFLQVCADIVAITLVMHAAGGIRSGFGLLMMVAVAGGSILIRGRVAILFAALATMAVLGEQLIAWRLGGIGAASHTQAGIYGAVFFGVAGLAHLLANRVRASEALVAKRDVDLRNLAELNEYVIRRMQNGILVVDADAQVVLSNDSSWALLGLEGPVDGRPLSQLAPPVHERLSRWRDERERSSATFQSSRAGLEVTASFATLGSQGTGAIIFLEDASAMTQRAQRLKLASLGRLTASIAHEIRNPLGAISHAGQLLNESDALSVGDRRLSEIVQDNCRRVNSVIEAVLELSRRSPAVRENVPLTDWTNAFVAEHNQSEKVRFGELEAQADSETLLAPFDSNQLHQVVSNLTENGFRHSPAGSPVRLAAGLHPETRRPYLDVIDEGLGISASDRDQVFEPFFTTRSEGTGLGLYIARELCEANQASLRLLSTRQGCQFRITFADPRRLARSAAEEMPA